MRLLFGLVLTAAGLALGFIRWTGAFGPPYSANGSILLIALFLIPGIYFLGTAINDRRTR